MEDELSYTIIGAAIEVHQVLGGPGLLESIYEAALYHELITQGLNVQKQKPVKITYKGTIIKEPLYIDLLVENKIIIEVKATEKNHPIHETQLLTYLKMSNLKLGLLINFGALYVKNGITRIVNDL